MVRSSTLESSKVADSGPEFQSSERKTFQFADLGVDGRLWQYVNGQIVPAAASVES